MARQRKKISTRKLDEAYKFQDYLLWELMGDNMGTKPKHPLPEGKVTFPEKKAFLDTMFKGAEQGRKNEEEQEPISGLDLIKGRLADERRESTSRGNTWGAAENSADESDPSAISAKS